MASQPLSKIEAFTYLRIARNLNAQRQQKKDKTKDIAHMGSGETGEVEKWQKKTKTGREQKEAKNTKSGKVAKKWQDRKSGKQTGRVGKVAKETANPFSHSIRRLPSGGGILFLRRTAVSPRAPAPRKMAKRTKRANCAILSRRAGARSTFGGTTPQAVARYCLE